MWFKHNKILSGKVLLTLAILFIVGLTGLGCIEGLRPIGWAGGTVSGDTLFISSEEGKLVAINTATGNRQWSEPLKMATQAGVFGCAPQAGAGCSSAPAGVAIYGTPAVSGDLVYVGGYNGKIYAYNASSLETRWIYPREGNLEPIVGGLVVSQGKVYFGASDGKVYALDAATGDKQWEFDTGDTIWATPAIDGNTLFIGSFDKKFYALDTARGTQKWVFETEGAIASTPLVHDSTVYIGSFDKNLYAVAAADGSLKWKFEADNWFWAKPIVHNDTIYAGSLDGKVYALRTDNGNKVTEFNLESPISSSPVVVNGSIILASRQGVLYTLDPTSNQIRQLADIEAGVFGPLSASEGIIYLHTQDLTLHRIKADTGAMLPPISLKSSE